MERPRYMSQDLIVAHRVVVQWIILLMTSVGVNDKKR